MTRKQMAAEIDRMWYDQKEVFLAALREGLIKYERADVLGVSLEQILEESIMAAKTYL